LALIGACYGPKRAYRCEALVAPATLCLATVLIRTTVTQTKRRDAKQTLTGILGET